MEHGQIGYAFEIVFFVKRQDIRDFVVFHYNAVNDVANAGMITENSLPDMIEKFHAVIILPRTNIEEENF